MSLDNPIMPGQTFSPPSAPRRTNWKLIIGLLVGFFALVIAAVCGLILLIFSLMRGSDVATEALARARSNPTVVKRLGTPITEGWFVSGSLNVSTGSGDADLTVPISGPKGNGTIYLTAHKTAGTWTYSVLQVAIAGSGEKIDLLAPPNITWGLKPVAGVKGR
jgi:hypothetical protein